MSALQKLVKKQPVASNQAKKIQNIKRSTQSYKSLKSTKEIVSQPVSRVAGNLGQTNSVLVTPIRKDIAL